MAKCTDGLVRVEVKDDGNCLWRAAAEGLRDAGVSKITFGKLKNVLATHMAKNTNYAESWDGLCRKAFAPTARTPSARATRSTAPS